MCKLYESILNGGIILNFEFGTVDKFMNDFIQNKYKQKSNIFLKLNETDYYEENKSGTLCHYPGCCEKAIESHTYPKSFLRTIADGNKVLATDIKHIVGNIYDKGVLDLVIDTNIKYSGVQPLFCKKHDFDLFKAIEVKDFNTDLKSYLCLFLYRSYIYDYQLESEVHNPIVNRKINIERDYSKKISKEDESRYLFEQELSTKIISENANFHNSDVLKNRFDNIFIEKKSPNYTDFCQYFELKYYDLGFLPNFFASGTMFFSANPTRSESPLQSIYAIIPEKNLKTAYFCILIPNESKDSMKIVIKNIEAEYSKSDKSDFIKIIEFLLLDASQNIIMTESLYKKLQNNNEYQKLLKVSMALAFARLKIFHIPSESFRSYSYTLLQTFKLINKN